MYNRLNNIQINLNLHLSHLQTGSNSFSFTQISYTVRCGRKYPNISILELPHYLEMVKVRGKEAVSFIFFFVVVQYMFLVTIAIDLFPVLFLVYQIFHFCYKIILNQNLVVTLSDILASYCVSLHYLLT